MQYDLFLPFRLSIIEFMKQLRENMLTEQGSSSNITIKTDGGPGSGRYPKGSGDESKRSKRKRKTQSLPMTKKEKAKVTHDINNIYHAKYEGKSHCYIRTHSNKPDSPAYVYY